MALIQCVECGRQISDQAPTCPGCGAPANLRSMPDGQSKASNTMGTVAIVLGLASIMMPYFAAVFLVPATFVTGIIAFRKGQRKLGAVAIVLAILGIIGIVSVSNKISGAQRELERSLRSIR